jgi:hypothetical protein
MESNHEWIYELDSVTINSKKYYFRCVWSFDKKAQNDNNPSMQLIFNIWNDTDKVWIDWNTFKGSYLAEKLTDYIKNTINGQRTCYWDHKLERSFK